MGITKHLTADELHRIIMRKKITYDQIKRLDPQRFADLESTMQMLYDHGSDFQSKEAKKTPELKEPKKLNLLAQVANIRKSL